MPDTNANTHDNRLEQRYLAAVGRGDWEDMGRCWELAHSLGEKALATLSASVTVIHAVMVAAGLFVDQHEDSDACPGCGCRPGDGLTPGCEAEVGCGYWRELARQLGK